MENLPIVTPGQNPTDFNLDEYVFIRGYPRPRRNVEYVEQMMGGTLVKDEEAGLIVQLDLHLLRAKQELGYWPDLLKLPSEPFVYFCPVPFDVNFFGAVLKSWRKPAWFRVKKSMNVPWSNVK